MWLGGLYLGEFELIIINEGDSNDICHDATCWSIIRMYDSDLN
jgi:hypothetical protein